MIHDVAIVGGGICGLSIGWKLAKRGLRVLILEKGEAGHGATWAALGILFPRVGDDPRGPAFTKLCVESHRLCRLSPKRWNQNRELRSIKAGRGRCSPHSKLVRKTS